MVQANKDNSRTRLRTFHAGALLFGISEEEIATVAEWRPPAPLPHAPSTVLGVVSIQGRMLTVLDPAQLLDEESSKKGSSWNSIVALRGDEQLALAVEDIGDTIEMPESGLQNPSAIENQLVRGVICESDQMINVIEVKELFSTAMRGRERRRRRF
jgi:purine-binding chemotaxis protein CheW